MASVWKAALAATMMMVGGVVAPAANAAQYFPQFTHLQDGEDIANYYNGGYATDDTVFCNGSSPFGTCYNSANAANTQFATPGNSGAGPSWGITFSNEAAVVSNVIQAGNPQDEGYGAPLATYSNNPVPGSMAMLFVNTSSATMNVAGGFDTGFSFEYAAQDGQALGTQIGSISVYSGMNGTGTLLGTAALDDTTTDLNGPSFTYDAWAVGSIAFAGTAKSVVFTGPGNNILYQVVSIGTSTPNLDPPVEPPPVHAPEPASLAILGASLAGLGLIRRLKRI